MALAAVAVLTSACTSSYVVRTEDLRRAEELNPTGNRIVAVSATTPSGRQTYLRVDLITGVDADVGKARLRVKAWDFRVLNMVVGGLLLTGGLTFFAFDAAHGFDVKILEIHGAILSVEGGIFLGAGLISDGPEAPAATPGPPFPRQGRGNGG